MIATRAPICEHSSSNQSIVDQKKPEENGTIYECNVWALVCFKISLERPHITHIFYMKLYWYDQKMIWCLRFWTLNALSLRNLDKYSDGF